MKKIILLVLVFVFTSCEFYNDKVEFKIINESNFIIDSLRIQPNEKDFIGLKIKEEKKYFIHVNELPNTDGAYVLKFKINNEEKSLAFGYFSNGTPLGERFEISIEKDTVKIITKLE